jgi:hypothetical protein
VTCRSRKLSFTKKNTSSSSNCLFTGADAVERRTATASPWMPTRWSRLPVRITAKMATKKTIAPIAIQSDVRDCVPAHSTFGSPNDGGTGITHGGDCLLLAHSAHSYISYPARCKSCLKTNVPQAAFVAHHSS